MITLFRYFYLVVATIVLSSCSTAPPSTPVQTVEYVDIKRFMGDWYVIANIPTFIETKAHNAIESYRLAEDGTIDTHFSFNNGSFDGPRKHYNPTGFIKDKNSNSVWLMQFIWPLKADYRIMYLDSEYTQTIIGRNQRDYVWIMARTPQISDDDYKHLSRFIEQQGYDISKLQKVPQKWPITRQPE